MNRLIKIKWYLELYVQIAKNLDIDDLSNFALDYDKRLFLKQLVDIIIIWTKNFNLQHWNQHEIYNQLNLQLGIFSLSFIFNLLLKLI